MIYIWRVHPFEAAFRNVQLMVCWSKVVGVIRHAIVSALCIIYLNKNKVATPWLMVLQLESSTECVERESAIRVTVNWPFEINLFCHLKLLSSFTFDVAFTFVHTELEDRVRLSWEVKLWLRETQRWLRRERRRSQKYPIIQNHLIVGRLKRKNIFQRSLVGTL